MGLLGLLDLLCLIVKVRKLWLTLDNLHGLTQDHLRAGHLDLPGLETPHVMHHRLLPAPPPFSAFGAAFGSAARGGTWAGWVGWYPADVAPFEAP